MTLPISNRMRSRVLLTDGHERTALATCRSLSRAGYRVGATASTRPAAGQWSRACAQRFHALDPRLDGYGYVGQLSSMIADWGYAALIPTGDASLHAISKHRHLLTGIVEIGLPPHSVVERCLDKIPLVESSVEAGLSAPETVICDGWKDARAAALRLGFPLLLKPQRSFIHRHGALHYRASAMVADEASLEAQMPEFGAPCLLQRRETGAVCSFSGVMADRRLLAVCMSRYRRTWPPDAGSASFSETVHPPPQLTDRVHALLEAIGWEGIFELELIQRETGEFAAIDFNPRVYGSLALADRAGAPLPAIWCDWLLNRTATVRAARPGHYFRWDDGELRHVLRALRRGRMKAAMTVLRPRRHVVRAFFTWSDPAPFAARVINLSSEGLQRARRRPARPLGSSAEAGHLTGWQS